MWIYIDPMGFEPMVDLRALSFCGLFSIMARGGYAYFITFIAGLSRYGYVYLMKYKSKVFEIFKKFEAKGQNQTGKSIKILRSDRGDEYLRTKFVDYLKVCGIVSNLTPPYTPQLNGVAKHRNRTLLNMVRSMLIYTDLPISLWGYVILFTIYLIN